MHPQYYANKLTRQPDKRGRLCGVLCRALHCLASKLEVLMTQLLIPDMHEMCLTLICHIHVHILISLKSGCTYVS